MSSRIDSLVQSLFQKESLDQCSVQELKQLAEQFPYFDIPPLLLAKKIGATDADAASLYVQNPLWLERLLSDGQNDAVISPSTKTNEPSMKADIPESAPEKEIAEVQESWPIDESGTQELNTAGPSVNITDESVNKMDQPESDQHWPADDSHLPGAVVEKISRPKEEPEPEQEETLVAGSEEEFPIAKSNDQQDESTTFQEDDQIVSDPITEEEEQEPDVPLNIPSFKEIPPSTGKEELVFEPYHAVDYFASQGIKYKSEEQPVDKFGKQLRSFTEWLKTMKRLPATAIEQTANEPAISNVEQLAEHSLQEGDVITEAMAEVWKKQGNAGKAITIYEKLSLLEPSKSHYFAAKIEELKKTD